MIEVEALDFIETFPTYEEFRSQEKAILITKYSALVGTTTDDDFESIYKDTYNFVMQTIYNYYDNYYLTSATKDRFLTLLGTIISGKLPAYKVKYDNYLNARNIVYDNLTSRDSSSTSSGTESGSGKQNYKDNKSGSRSSTGSSKYADTPENIDASEDFVDEYTTGQSKDSNTSTHTDESSTNTDFSNTRVKSGDKTYNETLKGGAKQLWENVQSIPSEIYKEVITITAKLFFSESMEERNYPCAYMTLTAKVKDLEDKQVTGIEQVLNTYDLVTTITTEAQNFSVTTSLKVFKDIADGYYNENKQRIDTLTGRVDTCESNIESLKERVTRTEEDIDGLDTRVTKNTDDIANINTDLSNVENKLNASVKEVGHTYESSTRKLQLTYTLNDGTIKTSTLTLPEVTLTNSGLMTPTLFSKLDQVVLYGTNYVTTGRKFGVRKDEDNDLYVEVPEGESYTLPVASPTTLGGIKVGTNLTIDSDGTLNASDGEGFTAGDGLETSSTGVTSVKTDSLTTHFNASKQVEVITDGESIQAGTNGLEVKVDGSTIKVGDNGLEAVGGSSGGGLEEINISNIPLWDIPSDYIKSLYTKDSDTGSNLYFGDITINENSIVFNSVRTESITHTQVVTLEESIIKDYISSIIGMASLSTYTSDVLDSVYVFYTNDKLYLQITETSGNKRVIECDTTFYINSCQYTSTSSSSKQTTIKNITFIPKQTQTTAVYTFSKTRAGGLYDIITPTGYYVSNSEVNFITGNEYIYMINTPSGKSPFELIYKIKRSKKYYEV